MKKAAFIFISILISGSLLSSCRLFQKELTPDKSVEIIYNLFIAGKTNETSKLGISEEESKNSLKAYENTLKQALKENFTAENLTVDDSTINRIFDARQNTLKKMSATFTVSSVEENTAVVVVNTTYFNEILLYNTCINKTIEKIEGTEIDNSKDYLNAYSAYYTEYLTQAYNAAKPSPDTKEFSISCVKKNGVWLPDNMSEFGDVLERAVSGVE